MEHISFHKLKSIAHLLKVSGRFSFQNFNLKLFADFLTNDPELGIMVRSLMDRYPETVSSGKQLVDSQGGSGKNVPQIRMGITNFDEWVAFCIAYITNVRINEGSKTIDNFIVPVGEFNRETGHEDRKHQFFNECIEPILVYIELQLSESLNAIHILQRYKILCEWYERTTLIGRGETDITKNHLSKYLFDQGFTYSLSETVVPSGRIDNLALSIGLNNKSEFGSLPTAIVAEAKIFTGKKKHVVDVLNQAQKRARDLGLNEAYCVVFNKTSKRIKLETASQVSGIPYIDTNNCRTYMFVVDLDDAFYESTKAIGEAVVDLTS